MKCDSTVYVHDWFLFKNPCNMYPLFQWENCRWLALGHVGIWVTTRHCHITTHLIHYLILPGTLKIQIPENSFWIQCRTFITPLFGTSPEPTNHRGNWVWIFPRHQMCDVSTKSNQFSKYPRASNKSIYFWSKNCGVTADSAGWGLLTVLRSDASGQV